MCVEVQKIPNLTSSLKFAFQRHGPSYDWNQPILHGYGMLTQLGRWRPLVRGGSSNDWWSCSVNRSKSYPRLWGTRYLQKSHIISRKRTTLDERKTTSPSLQYTGFPGHIFVEKKELLHICGRRTMEHRTGARRRLTWRIQDKTEPPREYQWKQWKGPLHRAHKGLGLGEKRKKVGKKGK